MGVMTGGAREPPLAVKRKVRRDLQGRDNIYGMGLMRKPVASCAYLGHRFSQRTVLLYGYGHMAAPAIKAVPAKIMGLQPPLLLGGQARRRGRKKEGQEQPRNGRPQRTFNSKIHPAPPSIVQLPS